MQVGLLLGEYMSGKVTFSILYDSGAYDVEERSNKGNNDKYRGVN